MQPGLCGSGLGQISGNRTKAVSVCIFVRVVRVCGDGVDQCGSLQKQSMYSTPCILPPGKVQKCKNPLSDP